jgi:hypothetical protein
MKCRVSKLGNAAPHLSAGGAPAYAINGRSAPEGKPPKYAALHFEHFRCGDGRAPCTQAGCVPQVLPAENWKEPKGVRDRHERAPGMLG